MRDRATAALVALALAGVVHPPFAMAQSTHTMSDAVPMAPADEVVDTGGWSLTAAARPSDVKSEVDPLAPEGHDDLTEPSSVEHPVEISEASSPRMIAGEVADSDKPSSEIVSIVTNWIIASGDNGGLPFMVIDKVAAMVFLFDAEGQFIGATPALLGITAGDDSAPGVGDRELSDIKPEDRTTPAGRFVAKFGLASGNRNVLWVDYETSISLHPVITTNKKERRLQRLRSPTAHDNRITFGCINVPAKFYDDMVKPLFAETNGIVYILPEFKYLFEVFPAFRPDARPQSHADVGR